ncbi:MFS transporter [Nocardia ninae]|uniref:Putative ABC transporter, permease protein n=1 Tax=Nocardia ninae NBRC 108245 TaxID=1210091 RepID=A0A511M5Z6_9NOCA|nr:MFS transporter [Nocardia ninae]GEM36031.1 putative ABC transporter, permease protein [Nocardia ninae NBRC 108245]
MSGLWRRWAVFDRPSQVLMVNQFGINLGFYMLMPYLASHLSSGLGMAAWTVGLVLGVRNFTQQGMFLVGGTLADRFGYKPLIVAGCALRTASFVLLALADTLPAVLIAVAATGFAGALFNPAVRAYLAADAGDERRVAAFAMFNIFYQAGILAGPLVGLALTAWDFRATAGVAAVVFAVLTAVQLRWLPTTRDTDRTGVRDSVLANWRLVVRNRPFLLFSVVMVGCYVLSFQVYLALPLQAGIVVGPGGSDTGLIAAIFAVSSIVAIAGQLPMTRWLARRGGSGRGLVLGMALMSAAFVPLLFAPNATIPGGIPVATTALLTCAALLALATAAVFPCEMDTVVTLAHNRLVATHYGFYNTIVGTGILLGNLTTGAVFDHLTESGYPSLIWATLTLIGAACATALWALNRSAVSAGTPRSDGTPRADPPPRGDTTPRVVGTGPGR